MTLPGCFSTMNFNYHSPDNFAQYNKEKHYYKSISSDGVRIKVYAIDNEPYGDIKMWSAAVNHYLSSAGYHSSMTKEITASDIMGKYTEYRYLYNSEDYIYALTIFVDEKKIYIIETGGLEIYYKNKREDILKSISSFSIKK